MASQQPPSASTAVPFPTTHPEGAPPPTRRHLYQTNSSQPFSRSAAKRQSVMALGSIKHLQHQFVKQGLSSSALGLSTSPLSEEPQPLNTTTPNPKLNTRFRPKQLMSLEELPPSPAKPVVDSRMPWEKEMEKGKWGVKRVKEVRKEVVKGLEEVCEIWGLVTQLSIQSRRGSSLATTTSVSRRSSDGLDPTLSPTLSALSLSADRDRPSSSLSQRPPSSLSLSTSEIPLLSLLNTTTTAIRSVQHYLVVLPQGGMSDEEEKVLRKESLEVLGMLKELEGKVSGHGASGVVGGLIEEDEEEAEGDDGEEEQKLVHVETLTTESELVRTYISTVDRILFRPTSSSTPSSPSSSPDLNRGHKRSFGVGRKEDVLPGDEAEGEGDGEEWPAWTKEDEGLGRCYEVLKMNLTLSLGGDKLVDPTIERDAFLESISNGNLLCHAYNSALRSSSRPFGFIPKSNIHELPVVESGNEKERVGMTFRRVENWRVFIAALKFRYTLTIKIDPKKIARKEEGWKDEVEKGVREWVEVVVEEWKKDRRREEDEEDEEEGL